MQNEGYLFVGGGTSNIHGHGDGVSDGWEDIITDGLWDSPLSDFTDS